MDKQELTDQIYDTIMGNVGFTPNHVAVNTENLTGWFCDAADGKIYLAFKDKCFNIIISETERHPELDFEESE